MVQPSLKKFRAQHCSVVMSVLIIHKKCVLITRRVEPTDPAVIPSNRYANPTWDWAKCFL